MDNHARLQFRHIALPFDRIKEVVLLENFTFAELIADVEARDTTAATAFCSDALIRHTLDTGDEAIILASPGAPCEPPRGLRGCRPAEG